jgi:hypothetical protein
MPTEHGDIRLILCIDLDVQFAHVLRGEAP